MASDKSEQLAERVRERVLVALLRSFSFGAWIIAGLAAVQAAIARQLSHSLLAGCIAAAGLVVLLQLRRYLRYQATAILFICHVWLTSTYLQSFHGITPSTALGTVAFMLVSAMFLGLRAMGWVLGASLLSLCGSAVIVMTGMVRPWPELLWDPLRPLVWLRYLFVLLFLGGGLAMALAYLVRGMERAAERARALAREKEAEQLRRESIQEALEQSRRLEAIARFAGGLAHEFSTSLVAILALSHRIETDPRAPPHVMTLAASIRLGVEVAAETARGLLSLSRADGNTPRSLELSPFLRRLEQSLRRVFPPNVKLMVDGDTPECVFVDPLRLHQALLNIALNARDAMPEGGDFRVSVRRRSLTEVPAGWKAHAGIFAAIELADTGVGMDKEAVQRAFEPFFTTKAPHRGTGLGLAIVRGLVYDAAGFMEIASERGHGSTITIFLPTADPASPELSPTFPR